MGKIILRWNFSNNLIMSSLQRFQDNIFIYRDDLFPGIGGGNKVRKMQFIGKDIISGGYNAVVTTGGIQSNHCRAVALWAAENGVSCHIVFHGSEERFFNESGNALLVRLSGCTYEFVEESSIGKAMDSAMEAFNASGKKAYYIYGGGHNYSGGLAYIEAIKELQNACLEVQWKPKYIVHASGTGSTQAGIMVGLDKYGWSDVEVIGISVARGKKKGLELTDSFYKELKRHYDIKSKNRKTHFNANYLMGGYENFSNSLPDFLSNISAKTGVVFDTTYSGKALFGMFDLLKKNKIKGNVLFWHTGGLMNLMT